MKSKVGICGCYAYGFQEYGGQIIKTKIFTNEIKYKLNTTTQIDTVDTYNWKKNPFRLLIECCLLMIRCENIIMLPAHNGVKVFTLLFTLLNVCFHRRLHYVVIGGWLHDMLQQQNLIRHQLKKFTGIYVETLTMKRNLKKIGLENVYYLPNFKTLELVSLEKSKILSNCDIKRFCTFSRVIFKKGVEDAINAVMQINCSGTIKCTLDIYGQIDENYKERFESIIKDAPNYIIYKGVTSSDESVTILKDYYMQLFPTHFYTEGVPGSIIDSYFAGLPVLASKWENFNDVIEEGKTGIGFEFDNYDDFVTKLNWAIENPDKVYDMKFNCQKRSKEYTSEASLSIILEHLI